MSKPSNRVLSLLLATAMLLAFFPVLPVSAADAINDMTALDALGIDTGKPSWFDENSTDNPFGRERSTMNEIAELVVMSTASGYKTYGQDQPMLESMSTLLLDSKALTKDWPALTKPKAMAAVEGAFWMYQGVGSGKKTEEAYTYFTISGSTATQYLRIDGYTAGSAAGSTITVASDFSIGNTNEVTASGFVNGYMEQYYLKIASGDFDGDGVDEIAVYVPDRFNPRIEVYDLLGDLTIPVNVQLAYTYPISKPLIGYSLYVPNMISLVAGDFNKDGVDDLALSYGYFGNAGSADSKAAVLFGGRGGAMLQKSQAFPLKNGPGTASITRASFAGGDVDGDGVDELVLGGSLSTGSAWSRYVAIYEWDGKQFNISREKNFNLYEKDTNTGQMVNAVFDGRTVGDFHSLPIMPANIAVGRFGGPAEPAGIYLDSLLISCGDDLTIQSALDFVIDPTGTDHYYYMEYGARAADLNGDGADVPIFCKIDTKSAAMGIVWIGGTQLNGSHISNEKPMAEWATEFFKNVSFYSSDGNIANGYQVDVCLLYADGESLKMKEWPNAAQAFLLPNLDDDTVYLTYTGQHYFTHSDPEILAVLASPPYFKDLENDDLGGSAMESNTAYGTSSGSGSGSSYSNTISAGIYTKWEKSFEVFGVELFKMEVEATINNHMTWETVNTGMLEQNVSYETLAGQDTVVFFSIPQEVYVYEATVPVQDSSGKVTGVETQTMTVNIPHEASVKNLPLETYERIAADYQELPQISGNVLTHTLGVPGSYPRSSAGYGIGLLPTLVSDGDAAQVGFGQSSQTREIAMTWEEENSFNYELDVETRIGAGGGGFMGGVVLGYAHGAGHVEISTSGSSYSGTVYALPEAAEPYGYSFNWRLFAYGYSDGQNTFPVINYIVSDVTQPPMLPDELRQTAEMSGSDRIALEWEHSGNPAGFILYRYFQSAGASDFYEVAYIGADDERYVTSDVSSGNGTRTRSYRFIDDGPGGLSPNTEYRYRIQTVGIGQPEKSVQSTTLVAYTLPESGMPVVTLDKKTLVAYPDTQNKVTATVENLDELEGAVFLYQWQKKNAQTGVWTDLSAQKTAVLNLTDVGIADTGLYRCRVMARKNLTLAGGFSPEVSITYSKRQSAMTDLSINGGKASVTVSNMGDTKTIPSGTVIFTLESTALTREYPVTLDGSGKASAALALPNGVYKLTASYGGNRVFTSASITPEEPIFHVVGSETTYWDYKSVYTYGEPLNIIKYTLDGSGEIKSSEELNYSSLRASDIYITTVLNTNDRYGDGTLWYTKIACRIDSLKASVDKTDPLYQNAYYVRDPNNMLDTILSRFRAGKAAWVGQTTLMVGGGLRFRIDPAPITIGYDTAKAPITLSTGERGQLYDLLTDPDLLTILEGEPRFSDDDLLDLGIVSYKYENVNYDMGTEGIRTAVINQAGNNVPLWTNLNHIGWFHLNQSGLASSSSNQYANIAPGTYTLLPEKYAYPFYSSTSGGCDYNMSFVPLHCYDVTYVPSTLHITGEAYSVKATAVQVDGYNAGTASLVTPADGKSLYSAGTTLVFRATAYPGYEVDYWTINSVRVAEGTETVVYTQTPRGADAKVYFKKKQTTLTYEALQRAANGVTADNQVKVSPGVQNGSIVTPGATLTFTGVAADGWKVAGWEQHTTGKAVVYGEDATFTMVMPNEATRVYCIFERITFKITMPDDMQAVEYPDVVYRSGEPIPFGMGVTVCPAPGYRVADPTSWIVNGEPIKESKTSHFFYIKSDMTISAKMERDPDRAYRVSTTTMGNGDVKVTVDGVEKTAEELEAVPTLSTVVLEAIPGHGYEFERWAWHNKYEIDPVPTEATVTYNITKPIGIGAYFSYVSERMEFMVEEPEANGTVTVLLNGSEENGMRYFNPAENKRSFIAKGETVTIRVKPRYGYMVTGWNVYINGETTFLSQPGNELVMTYDEALKDARIIRYTPVLSPISGTIDADLPAFATQPTEFTFKRGSDATLSALASVYKGDLTYQWMTKTDVYMNFKPGYVDGIPVSEGGTSDTFKPTTEQVGTTYYWVEVTNTDESASGEKTAFVRSAIFKVNIVPADDDTVVSFTAESNKLDIGTTEIKVIFNQPVAGLDVSHINAVTDPVRMIDTEIEFSSIEGSGAEYILHISSIRAMGDVFISFDNWTYGNTSYVVTKPQKVRVHLSSIKPEVLSVTPTGSAAPVSGNLVITFSKAMGSTSQWSLTFVELNDMEPLTGRTWSEDATILTVPYSDLAHNTLYNVKIYNFWDAHGNELEHVTEGFTFTTIEEGAADKSDQSITWDQTLAAAMGDGPITLTAAASSKLPVTYTSSNQNVATISGDTLTIVGEGTTTITAVQGGDDSYNPAISVSKTLAVIPPKPATYTVTLNANGGIGFTPLGSYTAGTAAILPTDGEKTGHTFGGWYADADLTGQAVTRIGADETGNKTFWAKWLSCDASLLSVYGQSVTCTGEGTPAQPRTASIKVANVVDCIAPDDLIPATGASATLCADADFDQAAASVDLPEGGSEMVRVKVTAEDGFTQLCYCITVSRAGAEEKTVTVGPQTGKVTAGEGGAVTYTITTANLSSGEYDATVTGLPGGVTADEVLFIEDGIGLLTLTVSDTAEPGRTAGLVLTLDDVPSGMFSLEIAEAIVDAQAPVLDTDLEAAEVTYTQSEEAEALTVEASVTDGGTLSYQWYANDTADTESPTPVGTDSASFTPPIGDAGTIYYYVVVTNTNDSVNGNRTASTVSKIAKITVAPSRSAYTITFDGNGGTPSETARQVTPGSALGALPTATRSDYTLNGWYTAAGSGTKITAATIPTENTTYYAQWTKNDSGPGGNTPGGNTPGGNTPSTPTTTQPTTPTAPETGSNTVETPKGGDPVVNKDGTTTLPKGGDIATQNGTEIEAPAGTVISETGDISIPAGQEAQAQLPNGQSVTLPGGTTITADGNIILGGEADVTLTDGSTITVPAGSETDGRQITVGQGGGTTTRADGAVLSVREEAVLILDENIPLGYRISIGNPFADIPEDGWFYEDVVFAFAHNLFEGIADDLFSPSTPMTRGMLVTVLYRLEQEPGAASEGGFEDLAADWYTDAVSWASQAGIVSGYGNGLFGPDDSITREQLATMLYRYAQKRGLDVTAQGDLSGYGDEGEISGYAVAAMRWANAAGLIKGRSDSELAPKGAATRAEVAAILRRFIEQQ